MLCGCADLSARQLRKKNLLAIRKAGEYVPMALDIYVGPLTRYYAGDWRTILLQWAVANQQSPDPRLLVGFSSAEKPARVLTSENLESRDPGIAAQTTFLSNDGEVLEAAEIKTNRKLIQPASVVPERVAAWITELNEALEPNLTGRIDWKDEAEGAYYTDKPGWEPYYALQLWAAYDEHPELRLPKKVPDTLARDPAYKRSTAPSFESLYTSLLGIQMWLPCTENFVFTANDATGARCRFGFTPCLVGELEHLNSRTWNADIETVKSWDMEAPAEGAALEDSAKFAFSVFLHLAHTAAEDRLPMLLDF